MYYKTRGSADGQYAPTNFAAIITEVQTNETVSLVTFGPSGIRFEQQVERGDAPGNWDWMPYQKEQSLAAKHDAAAAETVTPAPETEQQ